jgi:peptidoglycan-associated lipoprotein
LPDAFGKSALSAGPCFQDKNRRLQLVKSRWAAQVLQGEILFAEKNVEFSPCSGTIGGAGTDVKFTLSMEMKMRLSKTLCFCIFMALAAPLSLTGCGKKKAGDVAAAGDAASSSAAEAGGEGAGGQEPLESPDSLYGQGGNFSEGRTSGPMLPVYFEYDSSRVQGDQVSRIEHNGDFLKQNPGKRIRIEGNCDERGTREYNLALGERRASAAKKYLTSLGVEAGRISTVSWGEEKPLVFGQDEQSWAQNRRADFVFAE